MPLIPNIFSKIIMINNNSHAVELIWLPIIFAFKKYSSLWITTKNIKDDITINTSEDGSKYFEIFLGDKGPLYSELGYSKDPGREYDMANLTYPEIGERNMLPKMSMLTPFVFVMGYWK